MQRIAGVVPSEWESEEINMLAVSFLRRGMGRVDVLSSYFADRIHLTELKRDSSRNGRSRLCHIERKSNSVGDHFIAHMLRCDNDHGRREVDIFGRVAARVFVG